MKELKDQLVELKDRIERGIFALDLQKKKERVIQLDSFAAAPDFWQNQRCAASVMQERDSLQNIVNNWESLDVQVRDLAELLGLLEAGDSGLRAEIEQKSDKLVQELEKAENHLFLSGPHDGQPCFLVVHAGTGGTDAKDWAAMLLRMYLRYCENEGFKAQILEQSNDEVAGINSAMLYVRGPWAFGLLKQENGVHRLIRQSPFNAKALRQTSFAAVDVYPELPEEDELEIDEKDLRIDTFRSSSAGGQHVNVTDSAVRITHIPSDIVVTCQNERSQHQNKEQAMKILQSRLAAHQEEERKKELADVKGEEKKIDFGSQIRTYTLHPYRLVKDHRTNFETGNVDAVLDGDLAEFIEASLRGERLKK